MGTQNNSKEDNYDFLTHAPVSKTVLTMAVPTIVTMLVTSLYNMADTFFVGQIDTQSTAVRTLESHGETSLLPGQLSKRYSMVEVHLCRVRDWGASPLSP